jgi:circadian clock protein KaiB
MMIFLKLFIAGNITKSDQLIRTLKENLKEALDGQFRLEVFDVFENPQETKRARVFATPTLIKASSGSEKRIFGDLSDKGKVLLALGLA